MDHLFISTVRVEELQLTLVGGRPAMDWSQAHHEDAELDAMLGALKCRLDLNFVRPGKDILPAPIAGRAPDRIGLCFTYAYAPLKAGQRLVTIPNEYGELPVSGTFEIRVIPDLALDYSTGHHMEVQILETNQKLEGLWPFDEDSDPNS